MYLSIKLVSLFTALSRPNVSYSIYCLGTVPRDPTIQEFSVHFQRMSMQVKEHLIEERASTKGRTKNKTMMECLAQLTQMPRIGQIRQVKRINPSEGKTMCSDIRRFLFIRVFLSQAILPILRAILSSNYCSKQKNVKI